MPKIPVLPDVKVERIISLDKGQPLNVQQVDLSTHVGTHIDAPLHAVPDGKSIEEIPLDRFFGTGMILNVKKDGPEQVTAADLERVGAEVRVGDIVMLYTGWEHFFYEPKYEMHPYLSEDAAHWIVDKGIKMIGIDCITVDLPTPLRTQPFAYPIHHILLENEVLIAENVVNLEALCGKRLEFQAFPIKIAKGDAGQARIIAIDKDGQR